MKEERIVVTIDADGAMTAKTSVSKVSVALRNWRLFFWIGWTRWIQHTREFKEKDAQSSTLLDNNNAEVEQNEWVWKAERSDDRSKCALLALESIGAVLSNQTTQCSVSIGGRTWTMRHYQRTLRYSLQCSQSWKQANLDGWVEKHIHIKFAWSRSLTARTTCNTRSDREALRQERLAMEGRKTLIETRRATVIKQAKALGYRLKNRFRMVRLMVLVNRIGTVMDIQVGHITKQWNIRSINLYSGFKDVRWRVRDVGTRNTGRLAQVPQPPPMTFLSNGKQPKVWKALLSRAENHCNSQKQCIISSKVPKISVFPSSVHRIWTRKFTSVMQSCFNMSDIVVTGRYVHSLRNTNLRWRGSTNQVVHFQHQSINSSTPKPKRLKSSLCWWWTFGVWICNRRTPCFYWGEIMTEEEK